MFASKTAFGRIDIKKAWQEALEPAEIKDCSVHDMRHTFFTFAASQGTSNLELATAMGHRTLEQCSNAIRILMFKLQGNSVNILSERILKTNFCTLQALEVNCRNTVATIGISYELSYLYDNWIGVIASIRFWPQAGKNRIDFNSPKLG